MPLRVEVAGDPANPAVVFLHGLGVSSWMWADQVQHLSDRFCCITVDLPGNGASHQVPWRSFDDSAAAVADVIAATPVGRAHVVGLSLGGYVAVALTARHPAVVDNVVVSGITAEPLLPAWRYRLLTRAGSAVMRSPSLTRAYGTAMRLPRRGPRGHGRRRTGAVQDDHPPDIRRDPSLPAARVDGRAGGSGPRGCRRPRHAVDPPRAGRLRGARGDRGRSPDAHHAWNAEHPRLFSDMVAAWVTDRTVTPGLAVSRERQPPATAGMIEMRAPSAISASRPPMNRTSSSPT